MQRVEKIVKRIAVQTSAKQGSLLLQHISITVSCSTLSRIAHGLSLPVIKTPRILGVDDWAYRKGVLYGTVLIDMETSRPIDLLPSRESKDLEQWLAYHPGVEVVTRDRSGPYAAAIRKSTPEALQVADRFHLFLNLSDALNTYFKSKAGGIKTLMVSNQGTLWSESGE